MSPNAWIGLVVVSGIMLISAIGVSAISDVSSAATLSNQIDIKKKSESMDAFFDGDAINVKNTGKYNLEISMFRFYDELGVEVHRTIIPNSDGRVFGGALPIVQDTLLTSSDVYLQSQIPKSYTATDIGIDSFDELSGEIVTKRGRVFPIVLENSNSGDGGDSDGPPQDPAREAALAMIDGMGLQSRMIQKENDGRITHGTGMEGVDDSIKPYLQVATTTDFAATILDGETELTYFIPEFWHEYNYDGSALVDITVEPPNILGYSQTIDLVGSNVVSIDNGIKVVGSGKTVIALNDYSNQPVILRGDAGTGVIKIITSSVDLMNAEYASGLGYLTYTGGNPGTSGISVVAGIDSTHTGKHDYSINVEGHSHMHYGRGGGSGWHHYWEPYTAYYLDNISTLVKVDNGDHQIITGHTQNTGYNFRVYDTLPSVQNIEFSEGTFETNYLFPNEQSYLFVNPNGGTVIIKGETSVNIPFVEINNLPANIPYQITKDGLTLITGLTSSTGTITINSVTNAPSSVGGYLKIFPDSLSYRGAFSTVVFDNLNDQTIHINTVEDKTYVVHAYVNIPVTGSITVTNLNLNETLPLSYLDTSYESGDSIQVPVIPGYSTIHLTINGIDAQLNYADILGGTGIKIAEPTTSTITNNDLDNRITSAIVTAGTPVFVIATSNGVINAIMTETISGSITITNTYTLQAIPPPPPIPIRDDPLEGWVEIFVNGVQIGDPITLGINPFPDFTSTADISGTTAIQSVTYTYSDYTISGSTSVNVVVGDFVEFYVYGKISGEIQNYSVPGGFILVSESGTSTGTINIRSAHIQTSQ